MGYDSISVLAANATGYPQWGLSWSYDRYGNRTAQSRTYGSTAPEDSPTISTSTNRITALNSTNFTYDSNGNLTQDDLYKYKYDAENRLVELRLPNDTLIASYAFDGNSLRVVKVWGADRTFYLYAGTQLISEFEDAASNTYSAGTTPGQAPADTTTTMLYQHSDHLTTRLTTDNSGLLSNEQAHYPYGEAWYAGGTADPSVLRKFTSYQKEDEAATGKLNYAVFRQHSARVGRFLMADPKRGNFRNPQRLNRYAYVTNDPANGVDPRGLNRENPEYEPMPAFLCAWQPWACSNWARETGNHFFGDMGGVETLDPAGDAWSGFNYDDGESGGGLFGGGEDAWDYCTKRAYEPCKEKADKARRQCRIDAGVGLGLGSLLVCTPYGLILPPLGVICEVLDLAEFGHEWSKCDTDYENYMKTCDAFRNDCYLNQTRTP